MSHLRKPILFTIVLTLIASLHLIIYYSCGSNVLFQTYNVSRIPIIKAPRFSLAVHSPSLIHYSSPRLFHQYSSSPNSHTDAKPRLSTINSTSGEVVRTAYIIPVAARSSALMTRVWVAHNQSGLSRRISTPSPYPLNDEEKTQSACPFQDVDPFDPIIQKHLFTLQPIHCPGGLPSLVDLYNDTFSVNFTKVTKTVGTIDYCKYSPVELSDENDSHLRKLNWSRKFLHRPITLSVTDEHVVVHCYSKNTSIVGQTFKSRVLVKPKVEKRRKADYKRHVEKNSPLETMSVMIIGMDGMSKHNLIRTMPKTRNFIIKHLNARELNKFNKVGDNTFPNVLVLHSGHNEDEVRKNWTRDDYFDKIEDIFLWHHYQKAGYRTSMAFDVTYITAYHYLKKGWKHPSFDYYNRPLRLQIEKDNKYSRRGGTHCVGEYPELVILQDYVIQLTSKFNNTRNKPYFIYNFFTKLSHDYQTDASKGDDIYFNFFQEMAQRNVLNNTIVIFFSDHGARFSSFRDTFNGKVEINTPFVFFMFPSWFEKKYVDVMNTFQINQNRLTTFFDIHKTLIDLLKFKGETKKGRVESRAISLFDEIPTERNCSHAGIPVEFCNCKSYINDSVSEQVTHDMSKDLLNFIVNRTSSHREMCALLRLKSVHSILVMQTAQKSKVSKYYQITIETRPGWGLYEALMKYNVQKRKSYLIGDIVRLNLYKGQAACVGTLRLKPYCFCKG